MRPGRRSVTWNYQNSPRVSLSEFKISPNAVVATVDGTSVCEVHAVQWPDGDGRSAQISSYAIPQLDSSATAYFQDGTQFQYVSGATYTSDGYVQSIQSILDKL